jgi:hypothetical protein
MQVLIHLALYVTSDSNDPQGLGSGQDRPQDVWFTLLSAVSRKRWDFNVWVAFDVASGKRLEFGVARSPVT